ncbi:MAG: protein kinase [Archangiaceae bacterium]|nr:protein kinase [Archangiaceae bacterium]
MFPTDSDDLTGSTVGEYQVVGKLGVGGMGIVYEGKHPVIGKRVAIKVLLPQLSSQSELVQRFLAEARAVNEIRHRGIVDIFSFGSLASGALYFVMEYLEGESLDKLIERRGAIPVPEALAIVEEVLDALVAAHEAHVVHRDIKPSNLFLVTGRNNKAYVKLLDFGIAKLTSREHNESQPQTRASVIMGTPDYIAPEQAKGAPITPQTDLYAVGVVLYELLTGQRPFRGDNPIQTMWMHLEQATPRPSSVVPDLPTQIDELCLWAMQKNPGDRPKSADHFREVVASLRASFARNALGSPLTPAGSPKPLSAIEGLPAGLRPPPGVPPTVMETGAMPTARSLDPVPDGPPLEPTALSVPVFAPPQGDAASQLTVNERASARPVNPMMQTLKDGPQQLPVSMLQTVIQPPKRAAPADSTRIERMPEVPPQVASAPDLTPIATQLPLTRTFDEEPEPSRAGVFVAVGVVVLLGLVGGGWVWFRSQVERPAVVEVMPMKPDVPVPVKPDAPVTAVQPDAPVEPAPPVDPVKVDDVKPPKNVEVVRKLEAPRPPRNAVTQAQLEQRLEALERKLEAREKRRGEPDRMLRKYFSRVRDDINTADSDADRREASKALDELTALMR